jgi:UDP-N-acetylmuramoylalanine--D-glutamate ligase
MAERVVVVGLGVAGEAAARQLARRGWGVVVTEDRPSPATRVRSEALAARGVEVVEAPAGRALDALVDGADLLVPSPGVPRRHRATARALARGIPVWTEFELATRWSSLPLVAVTGTNGKTTVTTLVAGMLEGSGLRTALAGNNDLPLVDAIDLEDLDVVVVEASSFRLEFTETFAPRVGTWLNLAPDHLDWHGSMEAYAADKGRVYEGNRVACVYNVADKATEDLVREADVEEGCRAVGFTLGTPGPSQLGVVEGILVDRAFVEDRHKNAQELAEISDVNPPAPHNIANALAAAALARAFGVPARAVRDGLRDFTPDAHRIAHVADVDAVAYVDDSKATNTHAAEASLAAYESIVWIAGGLAKGATFDELVAKSAKRLRGVVLIGQDRALIREALARHAPEVPVVDLDRTDTGAMLAAVQEASRLAVAGDTVLLAPACASMDMFANYNKRGDAFAEAVRELGS